MRSIRSMMDGIVDLWIGLGLLTLAFIIGAVILVNLVLHYFLWILLAGIVIAGIYVAIRYVRKAIARRIA